MVEMMAGVLVASRAVLRILGRMINDEIEKSLVLLAKGGGEAVLQATLELDGLLAEHRKELDPKLAHYLERRSYGKALEFVRGASDIPRGTCQ